MTHSENAPESISDEALDQVQGAGSPSGPGDPGDTSSDTGDAAVLAWRNDHLSTKQTPVSAPDD